MANRWASICCCKKAALMQCLFAILNALAHADGRHSFIGKIFPEHAQSLLKLLQSPPAGVAAAGVQTACSLLLARWVSAEQQPAQRELNILCRHHSWMGHAI